MAEDGMELNDIIIESQDLDSSKTTTTARRLFY